MMLSTENDVVSGVAGYCKLAFFSTCLVVFQKLYFLKEKERKDSNGSYTNQAIKSILSDAY